MALTPTSTLALDGAGGPTAEQIWARERRQHRRFKLSLPGRFMRENKQEFPCKLRDISDGGAAITAAVELDLGERIIAYFDHIGGLEGVVVRTFEGGFALELLITRHKREKLAAQLERLSSNRDHTLRRHERITTESKTAMLQLAEGISTEVRVLDVSISGASVKTEARPAIGSEVVLGKLRAKIVRHHSEGVGLEFLDIQNPDAARRYFR